MNSKYLKFLAPILICAAGCVTDTRATRLEQVGPDPALTAQQSGPGSLQVYSARERVPIDINAEEFFWNNDYGRNEFLHRLAHTGYVLYAPDGRLIQRVRNWTDMNDPVPATLKLPPGIYQVAATAEEYDDVTLPVMIPVRIESGLTTTVRLDGGSAGALKKSVEVVRLPNGRIVGWRSSSRDDSMSPSKASS